MAAPARSGYGQNIWVSNQKKLVRCGDKGLAMAGALSRLARYPANKTRETVYHCVDHPLDQSNHLTAVVDRSKAGSVSLLCVAYSH